MPYYQWTGVDIVGEEKRGKQLAASSELLEKKLLEKNIALLKAYPIESWWDRWSQGDSLDFFYQLSSLLEAGIFTTDALEVLLEQAQRVVSISIIEQLHAEVSRGVPLSSALQKANCFDRLSIALIRSGEESGNVARALFVVCEHIRFKQEFYKKLRSSALMPLITFVFFLTIAGVIVTVILPKFALLCLENNQPLPWATQTLLSIKEYLYHYGAYIVGLSVVCFLTLRTFYTNYSHFLLSLPFLSQLIIDVSLTNLFKALTVLMEGGVDVVHALSIAQHSILNSRIHDQVAEMSERVARGEALSEVLKSTESNTLFSPDVVSLLRVGEESGNLLSMVRHVSRVYEQRVNRRLELFGVLFQPLLMIILGLLIAFLIFAVYVPIFELSNIVTWG